jgi:hypothetical protein
MKLFEVQQQINTEYLKQVCGPYIEVLKQTNGHPLYRGYRGTNFEIVNNFKVIAPKQNRRPSDTPSGMHDKLNVLFTEKYGHPFRNGIFATGDISIAEEYGTPYVLFPIGELVFLYSEVYKDAYLEFEQLETQLENEWGDVSYNNMAQILIRDGSYSTEHLELAIMHRKEVMSMNKCIVLTTEEYQSIEAQLLA